MVQASKRSVPVGLRRGTSNGPLQACVVWRCPRKEFASVPGLMVHLTYKHAGSTVDEPTGPVRGLRAPHLLNA